MPIAIWIAIFGTAAGYYAWAARRRALLESYAITADAPADAFSQNAPSWGQALAYDLQNLIGLNPQTSPAMESYIRATESFSAVPYLDPPGNRDSKYSIGYGHQVQAGDPYWPAGHVMAINQDQALGLFERDLSKTEGTVIRLVTVPLTQGQFDALVDFVYNVGPGNFASSTLLKKLNAGDYYGAAAEFRKWVYAGGQVNGGLVARREYDARLFVGAAA